jgi:hypothetical protein
LFVSKIITFPHPDFTTAVAYIRDYGAELIVGPDATELLFKFEQVEGVRCRDVVS